MSKSSGTTKEVSVTDVGPRVLVALDYDDKHACIELVRQLDATQCRLKVGKEMFTLFGPAFIEQLQGLGFEVFLDLKFHDIPNTVAKAVSAAASLGVWMVNVHASGGQRMMEAAANALASKQSAPLLIAVTVLTSMESSDLAGVGIDLNPKEHVLQLASLAKRSGLDGVVSSAHEVSDVKAQCGSSFLCVTPGIRPVGAETADQRRIMTPREALGAGSDFLVIGRPITQANSPLNALNDIVVSMS